jgi:hypothetical protein
VSARPSSKRQAHRRLRRRAEIRFGPEEPTCLGYSRNVSPSGMMIGTVKVFAPGTLLHLRISLEGVQLELRGKVVWARQGPMQWLRTGRVGMGVRFVDPPTDLLARLGVPADYESSPPAKTQSPTPSAGQS